MRTLIATLALLLMAYGPAQADGAKLYEYYCAQCHGADGKGDGVNVTPDFPVKPRSLADAAQMTKLSDADIKNAIRGGGPALGKSPYMPAWGKSLSDKDMDSLMAHLRQLCQCQGK